MNFGDKYEVEIEIVWDGSVGIDICRAGAKGKYGGVMALTPELKKFLQIADICYEEEQDAEPCKEIKEFLQECEHYDS